MKTMNRLIRLIPRVLSRFGRKSREFRKQYKEVLYDIRHIQKKTLTTIYNTVVSVTTISTTCAYLALNTYFKEYYYNRIVLNVDGTEVPFDENLELLALKEWNTAHIARNYKLMDLLHFFPVKGSDILSIGDLQIRTGVNLGIPYYFNYNTVDDIKCNEVIIFNKTLDQLKTIHGSDLTKQLIESLVLSEKAKRFAITREIHFAENFRIGTETLNIMLSTMAAVGGGQQIILWMNVRRRYLLSFAIRTVSLGLGIGIWFVLRQIYTYDWNIKADEAAVRQGTDYFEGGLEFYEKQLQRNAILYQMLGSYGPKKFTKDGEPKGLFTSVPSIKKRLAFIRELEPQIKELGTDTSYTE